MKILVVGAGMYVTGRRGSGTGTLLSSLAETSKTCPIEEVLVVSKNASSRGAVNEAARRINKKIGASLSVRHQSIGKNIKKDIKALCDKNHFDAAVVSVPDHLHFPFTHALLKNGVHCLVVKPLTPTLGEAEELTALQAKQGLYGAVEFHKRFDETNLYIKKALAEKRLGKLLYFTVDYSQKITIPTVTFKGWSAKSNIFQYLGVHYVDLIYFLTGFRPVKAMAIGTNGVLKKRGINTFDSVHATIVWENPAKANAGFVSQFATNWIDPAITSALSDQKYKVVGTAGRIECDQKNRGLELVHETLGIQQINPYFSDYLPDENGNARFGGYGHKSIDLFIRDVADLQRGDTTPAALEKKRPTFRESLVSTAVIDAVNHSLGNKFLWSRVRAPF